ncbi:hypothetical protein U1Q18_043240 [Sarracenia purpurea var. burkii]
MPTRSGVHIPQITTVHPSDQGCLAEKLQTYIISSRKETLLADLQSEAVGWISPVLCNSSGLGISNRLELCPHPEKF